MKTQFCITLFVSMIVFSTAAFSQSLSFCEKIDAKGNPVNINTAFSVNKNGSPVSFIFALPAGYNGASVNFDIYRVDQEKEVFHSTMKQAVNNSQKTVVKQMTFYDAGKYRIYVFDEKDQQLAKSDLIIKKAAQ